MHGYSPQFSASADQINQMSGTWWVAMTRPQYECRLANELEQQGAHSVLPLTERVRYEHNRKRRLLTPLFPSYLFFCGNADHRYEAGRSLATLQIIDVQNQGRLVRELAAVSRAIEVCPSLGTVKLESGMEVEIVKGHLMGHKGYVIGGKPNLVYLSVQLMGNAVEVEIEPEALELTGSKRRQARCPSCGFVNTGYAARFYSYVCDRCGYSFTDN